MTTLRSLLVATRNVGKLNELRELLRDLPFVLFGLVSFDALDFGAPALTPFAYHATWRLAGFIRPLAGALAGMAVATAHRAIAAFRALSARCSRVNFFARAFPPFNPPSLPQRHSRSILFVRHAKYSHSRSAPQSRFSRRRNNNASADTI